MPANIINESKWEKAKKAAGKENQTNYALISHIYKNMGGSYSKKKKMQKARYIDEDIFRRAEKEAKTRGKAGDMEYIMKRYKQMGGRILSKSKGKLFLFLKAKYIKRVVKPGGGYQYYYTKETIKKQKREIELSEIQKLKNEAKKTNMSFGKHKGKTVYQVLKSDPKYLLWAGDNTTYPEAELGRKIYVGSANMNTKMEFGKHEGKSIREIVKIDSDYLDFLAGEGFGDNHVAVAVYEKIKKYVSNNYEKISKESSLYPLAKISKEKYDTYKRQMNKLKNYKNFKLFEGIVNHLNDNIQKLDNYIGYGNNRLSGVFTDMILSPNRYNIKMSEEIKEKRYDDLSNLRQFERIK